MRKNIALYCLFTLIGNLLSYQSVYAQYVTLFVTDAKSSERLSNATVKTFNNQTFITNNEGKVTLCLQHIAKRKILCTLSHVGYKTMNIKWMDFKRDTTLYIGMEPEALALSNVTVTSSREKSIKINPMVSSYMGSKDFIGISSSGTSVLNQIPGVNIRENGGVGSELNFSVAGMTGKQICVFLDDIPFEYYGTGASLASLSANQLSGIEVYKGIIPTKLATDALGGAINFISKYPEGKPVDFNLSYSLGSFHTHRVHGGISFNELPLFYVEGDFNHIQSKNNYTIDADVLSKNRTFTNDRVELFHNAFRNTSGKMTLGLKQKNIADKLELIAFFNKGRREIQNDALARQPYGGVELQGKTLGSLLTYKKHFGSKFNLSAYGMYSSSTTHVLDTTALVYNWRGEILCPSAGDGEISNIGTNAHFYQKHIVGQETFKWFVNPQWTLTQTFHLSYQDKRGVDNWEERHYWKEVDDKVKKFERAFITFECNYTHPNSRLKASSAMKVYHFTAKGDIKSNGEYTPVENHKNGIGYNAGMTYIPKENLVFKFSYEHAIRLPNADELFGDNIYISPNLNLKPEQSDNVNVSFIFANKSLKWEMTCFYRQLSNIIWQKPGLITLTSMNLSNSRVWGLDMGLSYHILPELEIRANGTYQDIRNIGTKYESAEYNNLRIPNIPYLFGNIDCVFQKKMGRIFHQPFSVKTFLSNRYVHQFFLYWDNKGDKSSKNIIPTQFISNLGIQIIQDHLTLGVECNNIFNRPNFDNFRIQKPGRAFSTSITYLF